MLVTGIHELLEPERVTWMPTDRVRGLKAHRTGPAMTVFSRADIAALPYIAVEAEPDSRGCPRAMEER